MIQDFWNIIITSRFFKYFKIFSIFKDFQKNKKYPSFLQYSDFKNLLSSRWNQFFSRACFLTLVLKFSSLFKYFQSIKCLDIIIIFLNFKFHNSYSLKILKLCSCAISNILALRRSIQNSRILKFQRFWGLACYRDEKWGCTKWRAEGRHYKDAWKS